MNSKKFLAKVLTGAMALAFGTGMAHAAAFSAGLNIMEDDSNEFIFRPDGAGGYTLITSGNVANNDVLVQILDFPIINGINIDSLGNEVTGIALNVVTGVVAGAPTDPDGPGPLAAYTPADFSMVAGTAADWAALTGINIGTLGFDTTNLISLVFEDGGNNLNVYTDAYAQALIDATNGTLRMGLSLLDGTDFIFANDVPLDIGVFAPSAGETPGVTQYGTFAYELSFAYENLPGVVVGDISGSGTNLVTDRINIAAVIDDTQASFTTVPEPGTIALLGLGLVGIGASLRKRKA